MWDRREKGFVGVFLIFWRGGLFFVLFLKFGWGCWGSWKEEMVKAKRFEEDCDRGI